MAAAGGTYCRRTATQSLCLQTSIKSVSGLRGKQRQSKIPKNADVSRTLVLLEPRFLQGLHHYKCSPPFVTPAWYCLLIQSTSPKVHWGSRRNQTCWQCDRTNKQQLRRPIFCIFQRLLVSSFTQIPGIQSQINTTETKLVSLWGNHWTWNISYVTRRNAT